MKTDEYIVEDNHKIFENFAKIFKFSQKLFNFLNPKTYP